MEDGEFISKTQRKKQMHDVQSLGVALTKLSPEQLARLDMPETLRDAILEAKRFTKHEAIRRQAQYIGRIMRNMDVEPLAAQLAAMHAPTNRDTALFHLAEQWRTDILADPATTIARFVSEFPGIDARALAALAEKARAERDAERAPKHYRELFHTLNAAIRKAAG
jgi:ribosome-associated protein